MTTGVQKALNELIQAAETSQSDRNRTLDVCKSMARAIAQREDQMHKADEMFEKQLYAAIEQLKRKISAAAHPADNAAARMPQFDYASPHNHVPPPIPTSTPGYVPGPRAPTHYDDIAEIEQRAWSDYNRVRGAQVARVVHG